jgi:uncharacterized protein CbrC (UPF0167 family)
MTNPEHEQIVREFCEGLRPDADMSRFQLKGLSLLSGGNLRNARLAGADLRRASLNGVYLTGADLAGAQLASAGLATSDLRSVNFASAVLVKADLRNANLHGARLVGADLTEARFSHAYLSSVDLTDADLTRADLRGAKGLVPEQVRTARNWETAIYDEAFRRSLGLPDDVEQSRHGRKRAGSAVKPGKLPKFRYHPSPQKTGSIERSDEECVCCGRQRGYIYVGPVYAEEELDQQLCPWCIADGSAHEKFGAEFTDVSGIGSAPWDDVPDEVIAEVGYRTPGFSGWQQERWWTCCGDAGAFLGTAGARELRQKWPEAIPAIQDDAGLAGEEWEKFFNSLNKEDGPTAYVFQCLHCGKLGGYQDCD